LKECIFSRSILQKNVEGDPSGRKKMTPGVAMCIYNKGMKSTGNSSCVEKCRRIVSSFYLSLKDTSNQTKFQNKNNNVVWGL
jgi:hypothetical protein